MKQTVSINQNYVFKRLYRTGKSFVKPCIAVYAKANKKTSNRLGITASKKIGNAVQRNRARRVIREAYRLLEPEIPLGYDLILVARKKAVYVKMQVVKEELGYILKALPSTRSGSARD